MRSGMGRKILQKEAKETKGNFLPRIRSNGFKL